MEREKREGIWGDPSYRIIPRSATEKDIEVNHLHINTRHIQKDMNVILPLRRLDEFEEEGIIGRLAPSVYSFYGFQWERTGFLQTAIAPMAKNMKDEGVDAVILTPA